ncbi:MAG TPA: tRNA uridine-5-carboxymethylaminomethyl(34) synthesis enzyme MnmG, partial [Marinobacter sp.]|nr:tRNA uridine-5-carboxymethylaminomethyl(34) synthesis enzyme MnmG [Marinobacter sp.]
RAEYRLILREDNADLRLTETGRQLGLVDDQRWQRFNAKREAITSERQRLETTRIHPGSDAGERANGYLRQPMGRDQTLAELLRRPEIVYDHIAEIGGAHTPQEDVAAQVEIEIKYEGYISRQEDEIERLRRNENTVLPLDLDYSGIGGLSNEIVQKLQEVRPETVAQASRIQGVTPAAVSQILVYLKKRDLLRKQSA